MAAAFVGGAALGAAFGEGFAMLLSQLKMWQAKPVCSNPFLNTLNLR